MQLFISAITLAEAIIKATAKKHFFIFDVLNVVKSWTTKLQ